MKTFYTEADHLSQAEQKNMWGHIKKTLPSKKTRTLQVHRKSLCVGQVLAVLAVMVFVGIYCFSIAKSG